MTTGGRRRLGCGAIAVSVVVLLAMLTLVGANAGAVQSGVAHQEGQETGKPKDESRACLLRVTVLGLEETKESPVKQASVTVFAGEYKEVKSTGDDGRAEFKFATTAKIVTVRVVADHWETDQRPVDISDHETTYKVVLKPAS
jgi:hypothetical protein